MFEYAMVVGGIVLSLLAGWVILCLCLCVYYDTRTTFANRIRSYNIIYHSDGQFQEICLSVEVFNNGMNGACWDECVVSRQPWRC